MKAEDIVENYSRLEMRTTDTDEWVKLKDAYPGCHLGITDDSDEETIILDQGDLDGFVFRAKIEDGRLYMRVIEYNEWAYITEIRNVKSGETIKRRGMINDENGIKGE